MGLVVPLKISSGTVQQFASGDYVPPANLGSGTTSDATFLRGDGQFSTGLNGPFLATYFEAISASSGSYVIVGRFYQSTGDRLRLQSGPAGAGIVIDAANAAESAYAPMAFAGSTISFSATTSLSFNAPIVTNLYMIRSNPGDYVIMYVQNTDTTSSGSHAAMFFITEPTGGDPLALWAVNATTGWGAGIDNSDGDKWKLATGFALGAGYDCIVVDPSTYEVYVPNFASVGQGGTPGAQTDKVVFYSSDDAAGHTIPSFYCEGSNVLATGQSDSTSSVRVKMRVNGTVCTFLCI